MFNALEEARSQLSQAKYAAAHAAALIAGVEAPDLDDLRSTHVACLDAESSIADAHAKIASLATGIVPEPERQRLISDARNRRETGGAEVQDRLDAALGEGRR